MTEQLPLALRLRHAPRLDEFIVGRNAAILAALAAALDGSGERLIFLTGPGGSGRTHLLSGQCAAAEQHGLRCAYLPLHEHRDLDPGLLQDLESLDLVAIDDVDTIAGHGAWEQALFALFNRCQDAGTRLLFSADRGPAALPLTLPDLRTRLAWGLTLALVPLDDAGRIDLLQALADRRALALPTEVARYLVERGPRHPKVLAEIIERLDRASLAQQRRLTVPFVRAQLAGILMPAGDPGEPAQGSLSDDMA
ncbi:MAG: DnaA regulatory inactivator Hda [Chromatiaceae bacterium]